MQLRHSARFVQPFDSRSSLCPFACPKRQNLLSSGHSICLPQHTQTLSLPTTRASLLIAVISTPNRTPRFAFILRFASSGDPSFPSLSCLPFQSRPGLTVCACRRHNWPLPHPLSGEQADFRTCHLPPRLVPVKSAFKTRSYGGDQAAKVAPAVFRSVRPPACLLLCRNRCHTVSVFGPCLSCGTGS